MAKHHKFHYLWIERILFPDQTSYKDGRYYCYLASTFDKLLHDEEFVKTENESVEYSWIVNNLDKKIESNNRELVYIPTSTVSANIDNHNCEMSLKHA